MSIKASGRGHAERVCVQKALEELWPDIERVHAAGEAITRGVRSSHITGACVQGLEMEYKALISSVSDLSAKVKLKEIPTANLLELCMQLALMTAGGELAEYHKHIQNALHEDILGQSPS